MLTKSLFFFVFFVSLNASALPRDAAEKAKFRSENPCPATGQTNGPCSGYEVDHKKALMNGGADKPKNMQWLSEGEHKAKTKKDIAECKSSYMCKNDKLKKKAPWHSAKKKS